MSTSTDAHHFDVWITDRNMVYRQVPYTVVGDWITEGRLLEGDRVRPSGGTTWQRLAEHPLLAVYLPRPEPDVADDQTDALQPIEMDFQPKVREADDDDVDMIPLIDISMVLLVFFMMTAQNLLTSTEVKNVPPAFNAFAIDRKGVFHVGMQDAGGGKVLFFVKEDYNNPMEEKQFFKLAEEAISQAQLHYPSLRVVITASGTLPFEKVQDVTIQLQRMGVQIQGKVRTLKRSAGAAPEGGTE
jgi:biopolymer transport protein ExbD